MTPVSFSLHDAETACSQWGANCGPGALAGALGLTLEEVRSHIPDFERKGYTSPAMMNSALRSLGVGWRKIGKAWPNYGLVRIQWHGPWMAQGVPYRERYRHSHWIAIDLQDAMVRKGRLSAAVFDINAMNEGGWIPYTEWTDVLLPWLHEGSDWNGAWSIMCAIELQPPRGRLVRACASIRQGLDDIR